MGFSMVVSHKCHHQNMRQWAKQCQTNQQDPAGWNVKDEYGSQSDQRDQAASQHQPHVFFIVHD
jgi:hypothetical protein